MLESELPQSVQQEVQEVVVAEHPDDAAPIPSVLPVRPLPWWAILLVRASRSVLQTLCSSGITVTLAAGNLPPSDAVLLALKVVVGTFVVALLQNGFEVLTRIDQSHPEWRA